MGSNLDFVRYCWYHQVSRRLKKASWWSSSYQWFPSTSLSWDCISSIEYHLMLSQKVSSKKLTILKVRYLVPTTAHLVPEYKEHYCDLPKHQYSIYSMFVDRKRQWQPIHLTSIIDGFPESTNTQQVCKLTRALEVYLFNACDNIYDFIRTGWMFAKKFQLSANPNQIKRGELGLNRFIGILFKSLSDILTLKQTTDI